MLKLANPGSSSTYPDFREPLLFWNTEHLVTPVLKLAHPGSSSTCPDFTKPPTFLEHGTSRYTRVKAGTPWIIQYLPRFQGTPTFLEHGTSRYTRVKAWAHPGSSSTCPDFREPLLFWNTEHLVTPVLEMAHPWIIQYLPRFHETPYFSGTRNISLHPC